MDNKRTRLRTKAVVTKVAPTSFVPTDEETLQRRVDIVEVEVEGEHDRGLPIVRGVNKRKRDPRGAGRRLQQKLESEEGSVSVFVDENAYSASGDEIKKRERYERNRVGGDAVSSRPVPGVEVNTYVIIPEIMPEDHAMMKQLDKRRESSRLRVRPSKFREGFLLSAVKPKGEQKGPEDGTTSLEIVLPMDSHNALARAPPADHHVKASCSRASESDIDSSLSRPSQTSAGNNKFKITYRAGSAKAIERKGTAVDSSQIVKKKVDDNGLKAALAVVKRVMQIKSAEPFNEPVDPIALEIPDYLDVIEKPMDLGTIRGLLERGQKYKTAPDVYRDVQLVWSNCRNYNQEGDPIMDILKIAENCFKKHWNAAGLQMFASSTTVSKVEVLEESDKIESSDELLAAPEQRGREEAKRRKSKDTKIVAKLNLQKTLQFDTPNPRAKMKRSASVEQVMAESKAREDKSEAGNIVIPNYDSNFSQEYPDNEMVEEEQTLQKAVDHGFQAQEKVVQIQVGVQAFEEEVNAVENNKGERAEIETPRKHSSKTPLRDKDNSARGSSNKRRTFGTVHHKPDCTCVVCVGRRRKLAREEREGLLGIKDAKRHSKSRRPVQENPQGSKSHAAKVRRPPKPPQAQEAATINAGVSGETAAVEPDRSDCHMGNAAEAEATVEGVRYYPGTYELPLRKVNSSFLRLSQALFGNHENTVWRRHHSLGFRRPPSISKSSMFEAVHSLTVSER